MQVRRPINFYQIVFKYIYPVLQKGSYMHTRRLAILEIAVYGPNIQRIHRQAIEGVTFHMTPLDRPIEDSEVFLLIWVQPWRAKVVIESPAPHNLTVSIDGPLPLIPRQAKFRGSTVVRIIEQLQYIGDLTRAWETLQPIRDYFKQHFRFA